MKLTINYDKVYPTYYTVKALVDDQELIKVESKVLTKLSNEVKITGFRSGKAPANLVKAKVNKDILEAEVMQETLNLVYAQIIKEFNLVSASRPEVNIIKFVPNQELELTISGDVWPTIKLAKIDELKTAIKKPKFEVKKDDYEGVVNNILKQFAQKFEVERAIVEGDEAVIDFVGKTEEGELVPGASGNSYPLSIGSKTFIPGFEEELIGLKTGEEKTFKTIFPADYRMVSLQNNVVMFSVKINKVNEVVLPELTDEIAAKCGPYKSVSELKKDIEDGIIEQESRVWNDNAKQQLAEELSKKSKLSVPRSLIRDQVESSLNQIKTELNDRNESLEEYLKSQKVADEEELKSKVIEPEAEKQLRVSLVLREYAIQNKIEISKDELDNLTNQMLEQYHTTEAQKTILSEDEQNRLRARMLSEKTLNHLLDACQK